MLRDFYFHVVYRMQWLIQQDFFVTLYEQLLLF